MTTHPLTFLANSVMRTLTITRVHRVMKTVCAWPAANTHVSDSVTNPVVIASSRFPMSHYSAVTSRSKSHGKFEILFPCINVNSRCVQLSTRGPGVCQMPGVGLEEAAVLRTFETDGLLQGSSLGHLYRTLRQTDGLLFQEVQGKMRGVSEAELGCQHSSVWTDRTRKSH